MPRHVLVRLLAPILGIPLAFVAFGVTPGTDLVRMLAGLAAFAGAAWVGDVVWKRRANAEEIRRDLETRTRDGI